MRFTQPRGPCLCTKLVARPSQHAISFGKNGIVTHVQYSVQRFRRQRVAYVCYSNTSTMDALLDGIHSSQSASELHTILSEHQHQVLNNGTKYLAAAWDVLLHKSLLQQEDSSREQVGRLLSGFLMEHTMPLVKQFEPSEISLITRAMVATKTGAANDIATISTDIQTRMIQFAPMELCMVLWALSSHPGMTNNQKNGLFKSLAGLLRKGMSLDLFSARDLSILVWSVGHVGFRDEVMLAAAEVEGGTKIDCFTAEDVSRMMHGFACVGYNPQSFLAKVTMKFDSPASLEEFSAQDLALFSVSLGKLVVEPSTLFCRSMAQRARDLVPEESKTSARNKIRTNNALFDEHLNALVLWSFARLGLKRTAFATRSIKFITNTVLNHGEEDLVAIMWACCRLELKIPATLIQQCAVAMVGFSDANVSQTTAQGFRYISILYNRAKSQDDMDLSALDGVKEDLAQVVDQLSQRFDNLSAWESAAMVVALGTLDLHLRSNSVKRIQARLVNTMPKVPTSLLPKLAYSIAKLKLGSVSVIDSLSSSVVYRSGVIPPEGIVQIAYAFAAFNKPCAEVSHALANRILPHICELSSRDKVCPPFVIINIKLVIHVDDIHVC